MSTARASNPTGAKLLDESKAHTGSVDKAIFERAKSGLRDAVFNAAVAYAMAHYRADLNQLFASVKPPSSNDPYSPIDFSNISIHLDLPIIGRIDIYTLLEQYLNNCQWVIDIFEERIHANRHG